LTHKNLIVIHNSLLICYSFFEYSLDCGDKTVCQHDWDENCKFDQNQNFDKFTSIYERNIEGIYSQTKNFVNNTILNTIDHSKNKTFWNVCENFIHKSFWSLDFNECKLDFNTKKIWNLLFERLNIEYSQFLHKSFEVDYTIQSLCIVW
jgi:hypothetical protein